MSKQADAGRPEQPDRRQFLTGGALASGAMAGGLALGYGMFFRCAGEYLYPSEEGRAWMFVTNVAGVAPGQAISFQSPMGVPVVITRKREGEAPAEPNTANAQSPSESLAAPTAADFLALSSVCPHLGCRVHWEPQNDRFFCPCHLGTFDPEGRPTGGPPLAANQSLPEYPLRVENGLLYINMPIKPIDQTTYRVVQADAERAGASSPPTGAEDRPAGFDSHSPSEPGGVA
jgi:Rieske Fe-S protein